MAKDRIEVVRVAVSELRVHPTAQRELVSATLKKINQEIDLESIGALHAVRYRIDGVLALWVVDGQHRLTVLHQAGMLDLEVIVLLHIGVKDDAAASDLFLKLNTRAAVSAFDQFKNRLSAGHQAALGVAAICQKNGLRIERYNADGTIACVGTMESIYRRDDGESLAKTVATVIAAWGHTASAVEGKLIDGLGRVYAIYNGSVDTPALVKKLAKYPGGASALLGDAKGVRDYRKTPLSRCVGEIIIDTYNKGRRAEKLTGF